MIMYSQNFDLYETHLNRLNAICFDHVINTRFRLINNVKECALNRDLVPPSFEILRNEILKVFKI